MKTNAQKTFEWNEKFNVKKLEDFVDSKHGTDLILANRYIMLAEEVNELRESIYLFFEASTPEEVETAQKEVLDALADILFVTYGAAYDFGMDIDEAFERVYQSNMSKLGDDGEPIVNEMGKVQKGPNFVKPDLTGLTNTKLNERGFTKDDPFTREGTEEDNRTGETDGDGRQDD